MDSNPIQMRSKHRCNYILGKKIDKKKIPATIKETFINSCSYMDVTLIAQVGNLIDKYGVSIPITFA